MSLSVFDLGFLYNKAIVNGKHIMTKSVVGVGKHLEFREFDLTPKEELEQKDFIMSKVEGMGYFVSDLAIDQSDTILHSLKDNRFNDQSIKALVSTAFGIGLGSGQHSSYVVSGLPASHFSKFKDNIKSLFMGDGQKTHTFNVYSERVMGFDSMEIHGKKNSVGTVRTIEGRFLPQPHGAAMSRLLAEDGSIADKKLASKTVAVIDPGFGTTDVYVLNAMSPVERLTFSVPVAMNTAYTLIANKIREGFGVQLPFYLVENVVRSKKFVKDGVEADMTEVIAWAFKHTAQQFLAELYNHWKNTHEIDTILVAGGGGASLYPYLVPELSSPELLPNPQWSIAIGYHRWGVRTWKDVLKYG